MKTTLTKNHKEQQLSLLIDCKNGRLGKQLTADEAENVVRHLEEQLHHAGREAFKQWLLQFESDADVLEIDGKTYRFKMIAEKEFLMKFGHVTIARRLYQQDIGGPVHVPLDEAWNMHGQFATVDVRESLLFLSDHLSPNDVVACLGKVASFSCSKTTVQNVINEMGDVLEEHEDELLETVRIAEELPIAKTKCISVSLDGVNVRLNTPGNVPFHRSMLRTPIARFALLRSFADTSWLTGIFQRPTGAGCRQRAAAHLRCNGLPLLPEERFPTFRKSE